MNALLLLLKSRAILILQACFAAAILFSCKSVTIFAASPEETIRAITARSLEVIKDTSRTKEEKRLILETLLIDHCDSQEIAQRVLGTHYKQYASRVHEFAPMFITLISRVYAERVLKNPKSEKIEIQFLQAREKGDWSEIETEVFSEGEKYRVAFVLKKKDGQWRIVDVSVEGLSLVQNYRVQIARLLHRYSFDDLLRKLRRNLE